MPRLLRQWCIYIFLSIRSNKYGSDKKAIASSMTSSSVTLLKFVLEHDVSGWGKVNDFQFAIHSCATWTQCVS